MNQYCRYCSHCAYGDIAYCEIKNKTMSVSTIKRANHCKNFEFNEIDVLNFDHKYKPKKKKQYEQLKLIGEIR